MNKVNIFVLRTELNQYNKILAKFSKFNYINDYIEINITRPLLLCYFCSRIRK